jgi:alpha-galactosidase
MTVRYPIDPESGQVGLEIFPSDTAPLLAERRFRIGGFPHLPHAHPERTPRAWRTQSLVQVKLAGQPYPGMFAQGHTMRHAPALADFRLVKQERQDDERGNVLVTVMETASGLRLRHLLCWRKGDEAFEVRADFYNGSDAPVTLEMLSSFSVGGITPYHAADAPGRLRVHRLRSVWAAEGRPVCETLEELHLERSLSGSGLFSERFGQVGTMPVRKWFPFVAVEDAEAGVFWGANLAWPGSWQMEICRQHDDVYISGGLADREFGHWTWTLPPGEGFSAPRAHLSCVRGTLEELCERLISPMERVIDQGPEVERDLPIIFNEWCTTWGHPRHKQLVAIAERLRETPTRYLVIDAGWYMHPPGSAYHGHGDWTPNRDLFPEGLAATAAAIRARGLIPGLWFEFETVATTSQVAREHPEYLLKRDGVPVSVSERNFLDFNHSEVVKFLEERVIGRLRDGGFGYLKVDYNETLGLGADHPYGLGAGLWLQTQLSANRFWPRLRAELPELVIENCASGGHRLEPWMMALSAMSSFSDAHETVEIPVIAANLHKVVHPRQSQIWAVLRAADSERRLCYSLAATFLGRMCLSGDILELNESQWDMVLRAQRFYRECAQVIKRGRSRLHSRMAASWRYPQGWQALVRQGRDAAEALVVIHTFEGSPERLEVPLPAGADWVITGSFHGEGAGARAVGNCLTFNNPGDFSGAVFKLVSG